MPANKNASRIFFIPVSIAKYFRHNFTCKHIRGLCLPAN